MKRFFCIFISNSGLAHRVSLRTSFLDFGTFCFTVTQMNAVEEETSLKNLWASSYEAWKDVDAEHSIIYLCPLVHHIAETKMCFSKKILSSNIISIGAWNPLGKICDHKENEKAHEELEYKLNGFEWPNSVWRSKSYGFSIDWFEPGFIIGCHDKKDYIEVKTHVVELAKHFKQGAVYEYFPTNSDSVLLRKTVAILSSSIVEADSLITICERPTFLDQSKSLIH
jgi:hypothetical protein